MWHQSVNCNFTKRQEYFLRKENKNNDFIPQFLLWTHVHDSTWCKRVVAQAQNLIQHDDIEHKVCGTFQDLEHVRTLAVYGRVWELSDFIKNILICVPKM